MTDRPTNLPENNDRPGSASNAELDDFAILKGLVEGLRESVPWQTDQHRQVIGLYMLAAYRLGQGMPENLLFNDPPKKKQPPKLVVV